MHSLAISKSITKGTFHKGSRHSSYTSHASRLTYTSHGDLLGSLGNGKGGITKERQLRERMNGPNVAGNYTEYHYKSHHGDYVSMVLFVAV